MGCSFCNSDIYIKTVQYAAPMLAPLTPADELRQKLQDLTGEYYLRVEHNFCPMCGERKGEVK